MKCKQPPEWYKPMTTFDLEPFDDTVIDVYRGYGVTWYKTSDLNSYITRKFLRESIVISSEILFDIFNNQSTNS